MKAAKRLLASLLSVLLALPLSTAGMALAAGEEQEPASGVQESCYKELATVMDMDSAGKHSSGYQAAINQMKINLKGIDPTVEYDHLALFINVYLENRDNPDDMTIFEDTQGQFQFVSSIEKIRKRVKTYIIRLAGTGTNRTSSICIVDGIHCC